MLVGLTGVGGGSLMTPLLVLLFGIHPSVAVGTDLLQVSLTKAVGSLVHGFHDTVDWRIVRTLAAGSIPATVLTILLLSQVDLHNAAAQRVISDVLGISLICTAITLLLRNRLVRASAGWTTQLSPRRQAAMTVASGALVGFLVTMTSVGAGAIGTTVLILLYPHIKIARLVGSDIAHAVPLTLLAGLGHWMLGSIDWGLLGSLLSGSVPGIIIGSVLSSRLPEFALRTILAVTMAMAGSRMVI
ncbi:hypothetical protein CCS01_16025 [Rhodopila globiformis]|uniref:Probable membrane transporter protein n=2 Tax=Rhodopila globiformis TaxID=1071 RepID=A0A2S6NBW7_RHOGL|nr:sulfite exporter TauE/SafE family protein [Rhodopila globiformis]PPQ32081.1 hypothetical protein CCS01_16025 [Rhodopila globiformis]